MGLLLLEITDNYFIFLMTAIQSQEKFPVNLPMIHKMFSNCVASHKDVFLIILSDCGSECLIFEIKSFKAS